MVASYVMATTVSISLTEISQVENCIAQLTCQKRHKRVHKMEIWMSPFYVLFVLN